MHQVSLSNPDSSLNCESVWFAVLQNSSKLPHRHFKLITKAQIFSSILSNQPFLPGSSLITVTIQSSTRSPNTRETHPRPAPFTLLHNCQVLCLCPPLSPFVTNIYCFPSQSQFSPVLGTEPGFPARRLAASHSLEIPEKMPSVLDW